MENNYQLKYLPITLHPKNSNFPVQMPRHLKQFCTNEELATLNENEEIVPYIHLVYHYNIQQSAMPHKRELPSCLGKDVKIGKVLLFVNDLFFFSPLTFLKSTFLDQWPNDTHGASAFRGSERTLHENTYCVKCIVLFWVAQKVWLNIS